MSTREERERLTLLQGTLDLLILRTLVFGPQHGQGIARAIQQTSEDALLVEHGALYPAQQCIRSEEHTSELQSQSNLVCRLLLEKKKHVPTHYSLPSTCQSLH